MTKKIKQVVFSEYGSPEVLRVVESEMPRPQQGELLIKVNAIGVNYSDILRRKNTYFMPTPLPYVLGAEIVGEIEELGQSVGEPFTKGTRVLAILPQSGGYASHVVVNTQYCVPLPPSIDDKTATAIFVQGSTAQLMISQVAKEVKGKTVLVSAAAGGVGSLLVQLSKMHGAKVIGAAGSEEKLQFVKSLGVDSIVDYSKPNWNEVVRSANNDRGVDIVFEMVGGEVYNQSVKSLDKGGQLIIYGCASGVQGSMHPEYWVDENLTQSGFNLAYYIQHKMPLWKEALGVMIGLFAQGKLKVEAIHSFQLKEAARAHQMIEARKTHGKVILIP